MKISVYITSYNQEAFLRVAVDSVLNQTLKPYEIIIIDDCSSDSSQNLIEQYSREYPELIKYHFNTENKGITKSRNIALSLISGDYATWLDGDDFYLPRKLEVQAKIMKEKQVDLVYTNFYYTMGPSTDYIRIWCSDVRELPRTENIYYQVIARDFPRMTLFRYELVKSEVLKNVGGYDEHLKIYEDFDFRIRLCKEIKTSFSLEPLSGYRLHEDGLSRAPQKLHLDSLSYIYEKYEDDILQLPGEEQQRIRNKINEMLSLKKDEVVKKNTLKSLLKRLKLILTN